MDLIRKMSSGLRSSQDLSAAVAQSKTDDAVTQLGESSDREQDNGDVHEDAGAGAEAEAVGQQQQKPEVEDDDDEEEEEEEQQGGSTNNDQETAPAIRAQAPVSDEYDAFDDDDDDDAGEDEEEEDEGEDDGEDDGEGSYGSGDSFNSALERMAGSSEATYDTGSSPNASSPVGSLTGPAVLGNPPSVMSVSQQGALMRLNDMLSGDSSLDTSVIDHSTEEEFMSRIAELAESRGKNVDDASFGSIVDALLPLVVEKSEKSHSDSNKDAQPTNGNEEESGTPQSPMPKAKLTAEDGSDGDERGELSGEGEGEEDSEEDGEDAQDTQEAKDGQDDGHLKIRAVPSELDDSGQLPHTQYKESKTAPGENGEKEEKSVPSKVRAPPSEPDSNTGVESPSKAEAAGKAGTGDFDGSGEGSGPQISPAGAAEIQDRPVAKLSEKSKSSDGKPKDEKPSGGEHDGGEKDLAIEDKVPGEKAVSSGREADGGEKDLPGEKSKGSGGEPEEEKISGEKPVRSDVEAEDQKLPGQKPLRSAEAGGGEVENETVPVNLDDGGDEAENEEEDDVDEEDEEDDEEEDGDDLRSTAPAASAGAVNSGAGGGGEPDSTPSLGSAGPSLPARPTRPSRPSLASRDPSRPVQQSPNSGATAPASASSADDSHPNGEAPDGNEETREKLQVIRVKFLRLALRLGQSAHNVVVAQVLYRLGLAEQLRGGRSNSRSASFSFDRANAIAEEQEAAGPEELDFSCTIMMLGKTGVGKSATINSIFDESKTGTNAFSPSTKKVQVITGHVHGIKVRVIDTPGLLPSVADQRHNEKIMASVKGFIKKQSPDIVLYFDRLDMQSRDYGDLPLLRTITDTFGAAVWFNAIVVLTHGSSAPPDGPNGLPLSYEMFVAQRSHVVQQTIRQAAGDMRLMNPVSLVENHTACRVNRSRERVLPNGQVWKPQLLLLCFASKILAEANSLLKLQDNTPGRPFGTRSRVPPLPFLLSSLLQSRAQLKLPDEQMGDEDESDEELEEDEDSDEEEDYDQLPPFRRLSKEEVAELDEDNRGKYFEELSERERLFQKKMWKEELKRRREMKRRMAEAPTDQPFVDEGAEDDMARSAAVPVPMPDMVLPPSFDSDNPSHRYRYLETANQWLVRPVLETHGWDHDNGYDGMSVEKMFVIGENIPASVSGQITKDKKDANLNMECAASLKHGEGKVTLAGLDLQTVGKDVGYTLRSETRFSNFKGNKTTGGLALTLLGDTVSAGMKIEDRLIIGKQVKLVLNGGAITGGGDVAYGGSLEATLRDKEYPLSRTLSTLGVSVMDWHGDLAIGGNLQSQFILGKTMMVGRANLNNRGAGQISIRASSSEQLQMTLIGLLPIIRSIVNRLFWSQPQQ